MMDTTLLRVQCANLWIIVVTMESVTSFGGFVNVMMDLQDKIARNHLIKSFTLAFEIIMMIIH